VTSNRLFEFLALKLQDMIDIAFRQRDRANPLDIPIIDYHHSRRPEQLIKFITAIDDEIRFVDGQPQYQNRRLVGNNREICVAVGIGGNMLNGQVIII